MEEYPGAWVGVPIIRRDVPVMAGSYKVLPTIAPGAGQAGRRAENGQRRSKEAALVNKDHVHTPFGQSWTLREKDAAFRQDFPILRSRAKVTYHIRQSKAQQRRQEIEQRRQWLLEMAAVRTRRVKMTRERQYLNKEIKAHDTIVRKQEMWEKNMALLKVESDKISRMRATLESAAMRARLKLRSTPGRDDDTKPLLSGEDALSEDEKRFIEEAREAYKQGMGKYEEDTKQDAKTNPLEGLGFHDLLSEIDGKGTGVNAENKIDPLEACQRAHEAMKQELEEMFELNRKAVESKQKKPSMWKRFTKAIRRLFCKKRKVPK